MLFDLISTACSSKAHCEQRRVEKVLCHDIFQCKGYKRLDTVLRLDSDLEEVLKLIGVSALRPGRFLVAMGFSWRKWNICGADGSCCVHCTAVAQSRWAGCDSSSSRAALLPLLLVFKSKVEITAHISQSIPHNMHCASTRINMQHLASTAPKPCGLGKS